MAKKTGREYTNKNSGSNKVEVDKALIDNFIALQRVLTNQALKFEELSTNISKLLQLFEISAKNFAEKYPSKEEKGHPKVDEEFVKRLDSLLDQNKTIAKAIMMMEEKIRNKGEEEEGKLEEEKPEPRFTGMFKPKPLPKY